ncbi:hypothetical protein V8G54_004080 [Vigna mungo]|uniref:Uncharacterized protein n=1 Tax=Vigna mungo TaxID=3915 RepID=A0AAQ3PCV7_VIGMU
MSPSIFIQPNRQHFLHPNPSVRVGKQLSDLARTEPWISVIVLVGLLGVDLTLGESKLLLRICLIADIKCTVGFGGGPDALNFLQKFICFAIASSVQTSLSDLTISSLTASAHNPQTHFPWYLSLILSI